MAISVRYPGSSRGFNPMAIGDVFDQSFDRAKQARYEREAPALLSELYGGGGSAGGVPASVPAGLSDLGAQFQQAPDPSSQRVSQAHGDMGGDIFKRFMGAVQSGGISNPAALAAIAATGKHESSFSPQNAYGTWSDPSQSGQPGTSGGIMSWRGPRLEALQRFAQENGDNPNAPSPEIQAQFLIQEDPSLIQRLQQARTPQEAQQLMNDAWRFAGYDQPGGEAGARIQTAQGMVSQFGGQQPAQGGAPGAQPQQMAQAGGGGFNVDPDLMGRLFSNPVTRPLAIDYAQKRIAAMQDQNDPRKQMEFEQARLNLEYRKAQIDKMEREAAGGDESARVQSSVVLDDGTSVMVMNNGQRRVLSPTGEEVSGQQAADAIRSAREYTVENQRDIYGGRREGTLSADINLGGPAAGAKKGGEKTMEAGFSAWEDYGKLRTSLGNLDEAIAAIDSGAKSGMVYNMLPNITEASASLQNAMDRMGLDVIGSVTFGALSKAEMDLAMETAAPRNLQPAELRKWLVRKRDAQQKASDMLADAAQFLTVPGNTINDWIARNRAANEGGGAVLAPAGGDGWQDVGGVRIRRKQ